MKIFLLGDMDSSMHSWKGYEWESPIKIRAKVDLAKGKDLGGIFFWEIGQDKFTGRHPSGVLFDTALAAVATTGSGTELSESLGIFLVLNGQQVHRGDQPFYQESNPLVATTA